MNNYRKSKRPLTLLKGYSLYLTGSSDAEILNSKISGISEAELSKIKHFHTVISERTNYVTASYEIGIDRTMAKRMLKLFRENEEGLPLSYPARRLNIRTAFRMLLGGLTDTEILNSKVPEVSEAELIKAKEFLQCASNSDKMLHATIGQRFNISKEAVAGMLKIYRDKQVRQR
jgi:hypothetical protein